MFLNLSAPFYMHDAFAPLFFDKRVGLGVSSQTEGP